MRSIACLILICSSFKYNYAFKNINNKLLIKLSPNVVTINKSKNLGNNFKLYTASSPDSVGSTGPYEDITAKASIYFDRLIGVIFNYIFL
jgi:hypothetical protein